jgi:valyl-tRNA synthetase
MDKVYNHKDVEEKWYSFWEKSGFFKPKINKKKRPFSIIMPPPNANGELHIGHAAFVTLEDIMIRYHRMCGDPTLWLPGADHAGILTQVVFERELEKQGKTRFNLGREEFFKETYKFTMKNKENMENQLKRLGASCDWSREKFTLDPEISKIVYQTFKDLYEDGLIYRGERIINWCTRCGTALSDLEVEHAEIQGKLWQIKYPLKKGGFISVATTRPETMLGDTAVAVNPNDNRYKKLIGQIVILPLVDREIPIIADERVEIEFGTGAVKVTPAHDPVDFEIGKENNLAFFKVIGFDGKMTKEAGIYANLTISQARKAVLENLEKKSLLEKTQKYKYAISQCERCGAVIEPLISQQWFVAVNKDGQRTGKNLAGDAVLTVKKGEIKIIPHRFEKVYLAWMENVRDWCISRQIWWGHQLPVWYCGSNTNSPRPMDFAPHIVPQVFTVKTKTYRLEDHWYQVGDKVAFQKSGSSEIFGHGIITSIQKTIVGKLPLNDPAHGNTYKKLDELITALKHHNPDYDINKDTPAFIYTYKFIPAKRIVKSCGEIIVSEEKPKRCPRCGNTEFTRDPDTLDTWFSSAQWPFSTLKASSYRNDFEYFYPTTVMETAYDILFFWLARMIMIGLYTTGEVPFKIVFLHGLVRDEKGQKMSKSKGNVIDPLTVADRHGADAVRVSLVLGTSPGRDLNLGEGKIRGMRNFTNKIWNASRFIISNLDKFKDLKNLKPQDSWEEKITKLQETLIEKTTSDLENFRFHLAIERLHNYFWHEFCDISLEESKPRFAEGDKQKLRTQNFLLSFLQTYLLLLHPFAPFITEEVWQKLKEKGWLAKNLRGFPSIMVSSWPKIS